MLSLKQSPLTLSRCSRLLFLALSGGFLVSGCGRDTLTPGGRTGDVRITAPAVPDLEAAPAAGFFPLTIGNSWSYAGTRTLERFPGDPEPYVIDQREERILEETEELFDRTYVVEHQVLMQDTRPPYQDLPELFHSWIRYRQDRTGLYEADVATSDPPGPAGPGTAAEAAPASPAWSASTSRPVPEGLDPVAWARHSARREQILSLIHAGGLSAVAPAGAAPRVTAEVTAGPGGVLSNEIIRLLYPLRPGASWEIRPDPLYVSTVEAQDNLSVPAGRFSAWRISITLPDLSGPNDRILFWYGRSGMIRDEVHLEDPVIGTYDEVMELQSLDLQALAAR